MPEPTIINELNLLRAHFSEGIKLVEDITKKLTPKAPLTTRKNGGLSDRQMATLIAHKNKNRVQQ